MVTRALLQKCTTHSREVCIWLSLGQILRKVKRAVWQGIKLRVPTGVRSEDMSGIVLGEFGEEPKSGTAYASYLGTLLRGLNVEQRPDCL